jgi:CRP-like cAMP-binding protein
MVSPELLRRYPFFGTLDDAQLKQVAMACEKGECEKGTTFYEECAQADQFFLLIDGSVDLFYRAQEEFPTKDAPPPREFLVGDINPGEVFGISALVEPFSHSTTARAVRRCSYISLDAVALRELFEKDIHLAYKIMAQVTRTTLERMAGLRAQLAAL